MKPFITLCVFASVLAGLLAGWVSACESGPRQGETTVEHIGRAS